MEEIKTIRENAVRYFVQVKENIEKEEREVVARCDVLVGNLLNEEQVVERQQK